MKISGAFLEALPYGNGSVFWDIIMKGVLDLETWLVLDTCTRIQPPCTPAECSYSAMAEDSKLNPKYARYPKRRIRYPRSPKIMLCFRRIAEGISKWVVT